MVRVLIIGLAVGLAVPSAGFAQAAPANPSGGEQRQARFHVSVLEGVFETAVTYGAQNLITRARLVVPTEMLLLTGAAQARGFRLDGYGMFFDVQVPALRQTLAWSLRAMANSHDVARRALQQLREYVASVKDPREQASLAQALRRLERQVEPPQPLAGVVGPTVVASAQPAVPSPAEMVWLDDPSAAYTAEVKEALIDAMLNHSGPIGIGPDEQLTVAARDNERPDRLAPGEDLNTIILTIKGSDLAAFRAGRITKDEARKRVEVRQH